VDLADGPGRDAALCVVIDSKSGAQKIDPLLLEHGIQIQLPAYLAALRRLSNLRSVFGVERLVPAGVFYVNLRGSYESGKSRSEVLDAASDARRLAYRHTGRFSLDALPQLDRAYPDGNSGQFSYAITKKGKPDKRLAGLLEAQEFTALLDRVEELLRQMGRDIFAGMVKVDPYRKGSQTACDHCDYRAVCRIDPWAHPFRVLTKSEPEERPEA
jgi:ATP-dependent helicase/nuclease subunit B